MPSPTEDLLVALRTKKNDEMIRIITQNPELLNLVVPKVNNSIMNIAVYGERPKELIEFFVTHPNFDFKFVNSDGCTNFDTLLHYGRLDVITTIINKPEILLINNQSAYERAKFFLELAEKTLAEKQKTTPTSKTIEKEQLKIANLKQILPLLREASIKHAIATDNPTLLNKLETAGDDLKKALSTGVTPINTLTKKNTTLFKWFQDYCDRVRGNQDQRMSENLNGFFKYKELYDQSENLKKEFHGKQTKVLDESSQKRTERLERIGNIINKM